MNHTICDPEVFYYQEPESGDVAEDIQKVVNIITTALVFSVAPFLIVTPFVIDNLSTISRKVIAMISLSDVFNLIFTLIMASRIDAYKAAGDDLLYECIIVTFLQNAAPNWSLLWSFALLCGIWLSLLDNFRANKRLLFILANCIVWPLGILIPLIIYYPYLHPWDIKYNVNYLSTGGCQPDLTFTYANNGTRCLVDKKGRSTLLILYYIMLVFIIATQVMFVFIHLRLRRVWKAFQTQADTSSHGTAAGYAVVARHSRETVINSIQFSVTGFIYIMAFFPLIIKQILEVYYGPPVQNKAVVLTLTVYFLTVDNFVGVMNVLFYGILSAKFRREVLELFKLLAIRLRNMISRVPNPLRRFSSFSNVHDSRLTTTDFETDSD